MRRPSVSALPAAEVGWGRGGAVLALVRWPNAAMSAGGVVAGAWWAGWGRPMPIAITAVAAIGITAAANAWNDLADVSIDRLVHAERPVASGRLTATTARGVAALGAMGAVIACGLVSREMALAAVGVLLLARAYSPWLKREGLPGNITVAVLASLPFLFGAWAVQRPAAGATLVALAAPLHLAREIAKDMDDAPGDAIDRRTLPLRLGVWAARVVLLGAIVLFGLVAVIVLGPQPRVAMASLPALVLVVAGVAQVLRGRHGAPRLFKGAMACALVACLFARPS